MIRYFFASILLFFAVSAKGQLVINEIMQSNIDCVMDDLNEFPDSWVEVYNAGTSPVNLSSYRIGLSSSYASAWKLPSTVVPIGGYALIYCDKAATGLHTDFRLESGKGGSVYLFNGTEVADKLTSLKKQPAPNVSYGCKDDDHSTWGYMYSPTPKARNCDVITDKMLGEPVFSQAGGVFNRKSFSLTLSLPAGVPEDTEIRYTTDGSEPVRTSSKYTNPIAVSSTKIIRAKLFHEGWLSPRSTVNSYIFHNREQTLPVVSLVTNNKYLNDNKIGIYVDGSYSSGKKNYEYDWRRPVNYEFFEKDGVTRSLNQLCEMRIQGGATRTNMMKSLAFYANKRFGEKRFNYEFFPDQRPGQTNYKSFLMRNAGNDFDYLYMRDAIIQRTMATYVDIDWQAWRPVIVYINGVYKGILNIRERSNEDNIYTNYDELEDIDMIENDTELKVGTFDRYKAFKAFYAEHGHTWSEYSEWLDLDEYINVMAMNLYYNNQDFPGNNIVFWRPREGKGLFRILVKDTDFGLGLYGTKYNYNTIKWLNTPGYDRDRDWGNTSDATMLFRHLMEDSDFKREFMERCAIYMGDFLNEKGTRAVWDPMYEEIKKEYPTHRKLINQWWPDYNSELTTARSWVALRTSTFYTQLNDYYSYGTLVPVTVTMENNGSATDGVKLSFNGITLSNPKFNGKFFKGHNITLTGIPAENGGKDGTEPMKVKSWKVAQVLSGGTVTNDVVEGNTLSLDIPQNCSNLQITVQTEVADGISEALLDDGSFSHTDWNDATLYDLQGRPSVGARPSGMYLQCLGNGKSRKVVIK